MSLVAAAMAERYDDWSILAVVYKAPRSSVHLILKTFLYYCYTLGYLIYYTIISLRKVASSMRDKPDSRGRSFKRLPDHLEIFPSLCSNPLAAWPTSRRKA